MKRLIFCRQDEMISPVTVIVLSYNNTADTLACLDSLTRDRGGEFDTIVVDNGSTDGAVAAIRAQYPNVTLIELAQNWGWAGGNNAGIRCALERGSKLICLLNNDTIVPAGTIAAMAQKSWRLGPCLLHPAIDFAEPSEGAQLDPRQSIPRAFKRLAQENEVFELDFAYGACLMIPADLFRAIGMFDERFFLQLEETDFYWRARQSGVRSLCMTSARITHAESRSFGGRKTPMKTYYFVRNTLLLTEKHHRSPPGVLRALLSLYWSLSRIAQQDEAQKPDRAFLSWFVSRSPFPAAARAGLRDYLLRRFGRIDGASLRAITPQS